MGICYYEGRLREDKRRRTILIIDILNLVRASVELTIVEVEVRSVRENAITIRKLLLPTLTHQVLIHHPPIGEAKLYFVFYSIVVEFIQHLY